MKDQVTVDDARRLNILTGKGKEYTDGHDALSNFKQNAERLHLHPCQVLAIYMFKHINSIETYLRQFSDNNDYTKTKNIMDSSEGITSRIDDAINYMELLHLLLIDMQIVNLARKSEV